MHTSAKRTTRGVPAALLGLALTLLAAGCWSDPTPRAAGSEAGAPPRQVRVAPAGQGNLPRVVRVTGTLAAEEQVALGMKVAGRLSEITVDLGSRVAKGQLLARLDPTEFQLRAQQAEAALQQARARLGLAPGDNPDRIDPEQTALVRQARALLNEAQVQRDRAQALLQKKLLARSELDTAQAAFLVAQARYQDALEEVLNRRALLAERRSELALARQQLADAVLYAPFTGAVRERQAAPGQYLSVGQPIVTLVQVQPLRLRLAVPERDAAQVRIDQEVRVGVAGDPEVYRGRVARLSPSIEESSRTLLVEAEVPNADERLRPGAFASADIVTAADQPVILVPASAIVTFAGIEKVILVRDGKALERRVRTGRRHQDQVEILEGVAAGEPVVVEPGNLVSGQAVTVVS